MPEHSKGRKTTSKETKKNPSIRVNSSKVTPLSQETLQKVQPKSKFSEWRQNRSRQELVEEPTVSNVTSLSGRVSSTRTSAKSFQKWKKWLIALLSLLVLGAVFIGLVFFSPLLAVRTITVEGAHLLPAETVQEQLKPLDGTPVTRISEDEVQSMIGSSHILRDVTIQARPPHELVVTLHERIPVAVVKDGDKFSLVDVDGVKLGEVDSVEEAGLPEISGGTDTLKTPEFKTITAVLSALPQSLLAEVKEAKADSASTISLNMHDDTEVVWGTAEDSELKAKVLTQLRSTLGESGAISTYDVSSPLVPTTK